MSLLDKALTGRGGIIQITMVVFGKDMVLWLGLHFGARSRPWRQRVTVKIFGMEGSTC